METGRCLTAEEMVIFTLLKFQQHIRYQKDTCRSQNGAQRERDVTTLDEGFGLPGFSATARG